MELTTTMQEVSFSDAKLAEERETTVGVNGFPDLVKWRGKILDTLFIRDPVGNTLLEGKSSKR